ncbi:MAG TPA: helix-turn-helix domain-containing protein [Verrucomicrobiota bacterium]|nr:helix-turn-helix domain-containing protein [Verrucomicrobiota bacterium]
MNLLKQGSLTYLLGGNKVTIPAGRLAVFWAAIPHQIISSSGKAEYYVATIPLAWFMQCQFPAHFVDAILHARVVLDPQPQPGDGDLEMFERWVHDLETPSSQKRRIAFLEIESRLLRFAEVVPQDIAERNVHKTGQMMIETGGLKHVEQMALFIAQHYQEKLSIEQISKAAGLHPNYAMAVFKKALGITLLDCLTQHRVSHAQRLLATTNDKIIDVALCSGFSSLSRFHDAFRRWGGCSPKEYRKKHRVGGE